MATPCFDGSSPLRFRRSALRPGYRRRRGSALEDASALLRRENRAVEVADHIGLPARQQATIRVSSAVEMWQSAELWCLPSCDHEPVIALGEGGVDPACPVRRDEERLAKRGVAGLGRRPVTAVLPRRVERWHEPAEGARRRRGTGSGSGRRGERGSGRRSRAATPGTRPRSRSGRAPEDGRRYAARSRRSRR